MKLLRLTIIFILFSVAWIQPTLCQAATTNEAVVTFQEPEKKITEIEEKQNEKNTSEKKQKLPKTGVEKTSLFLLLGIMLLICSYLIGRKIRK